MNSRLPARPLTGLLAEQATGRPARPGGGNHVASGLGRIPDDVFVDIVRRLGARDMSVFACVDRRARRAVGDVKTHAGNIVDALDVDGVSGAGLLLTLVKAATAAGATAAGAAAAGVADSPDSPDSTDSPDSDSDASLFMANLWRYHMGWRDGYVAVQDWRFVTYARVARSGDRRCARFSNFIPRHGGILNQLLVYSRSFVGVHDLQQARSCIRTVASNAMAMQALRLAAPLAAASQEQQQPRAPIRVVCGLLMQLALALPLTALPPTAGKEHAVTAAILVAAALDATARTPARVTAPAILWLVANMPWKFLELQQLGPQRLAPAYRRLAHWYIVYAQADAPAGFAAFATFATLHGQDGLLAPGDGGWTRLMGGDDDDDDSVARAVATALRSAPYEASTLPVATVLALLRAAPQYAMAPLARSPVMVAGVSCMLHNFFRLSDQARAVEVFQLLVGRLPPAARRAFLLEPDVMSGFANAAACMSRSTVPEYRKSAQALICAMLAAMPAANDAELQAVLASPAMLRCAAQAFAQDWVSFVRLLVEKAASTGSGGAMRALLTADEVREGMALALASYNRGAAVHRGLLACPHVPLGLSLRTLRFLAGDPGSQTALRAALRPDDASAACHQSACAAALVTGLMRACDAAGPPGIPLRLRFLRTLADPSACAALRVATELHKQPEPARTIILALDATPGTEPMRADLLRNADLRAGMAALLCAANWNIVQPLMDSGDWRGFVDSPATREGLVSRT